MPSQQPRRSETELLWRTLHSVDFNQEKRSGRAEPTTKVMERVTVVAHAPLRRFQSREEEWT
ncbi:MAG: hypothetical protein ACPH8S_01525, partial [Poseidonia sp.]